jgi:hypothetical protein
MSVLRLLNVQGIAALAAIFALALLLAVKTGEARHWKKESARFERLYGEQQSALTATIANYRAAAAQARNADQANAERVVAEQQAINERTSNDFEARVAAARVSAQRLRGTSATAAADRRGGGAAPVPGLPAAPGGAAQAAGHDGLPDSEALTATEQAIQLDELIKWVKAQAKVDNQSPAAASEKHD